VIKLSVNVNKVATLRNSRGGKIPNVIDAVRVCVKAGAPGITVHPRADQRHITTTDVREVAGELKTSAPAVEFNMEGDPRPDFLSLVGEIRPTQCTLVPVKPGEITSQAGWPPCTRRGHDHARARARLLARSMPGHPKRSNIGNRRRRPDSPPAAHAK